MSDPYIFHAPTRTEGLTRLSRFLPNAGTTYAARRNYDLGPERHHESVSVLSPYIRHRLVTEDEVLAAVLGRFSTKSAEKFIQEVYWRTYWKGWLEQRPTVWTTYRNDLARDLNRVQSEGGLRQRWEDACAGNTGIAPFDAWAEELRHTGYLHNHARMWFASIWIFTLGLPWTLGADFFLRHLLDGDPASNTLSWRWVAGLQTQGKNYVARSSNITKYTEGRFGGVHGLAQDPAPLVGPPHPPRQALPDADVPDTAAPTGLLIHEDDLSLTPVLDSGVSITASIVRNACTDRSPLQLPETVKDFTDGAIKDATERYAASLGPLSHAADDQAVIDWAKAKGLTQILCTYAPVGPTGDMVARLKPRLAEQGISLKQIMRPYDRNAWPHATHGFFKFKENIPALLGQMRGLSVA